MIKKENPAFNSSGKRKAIFLIFSLWLMLLLSLFCLGLGFRTYISTRKTKLILNSTRSFALSYSGIKIARSLLLKDKEDSQADHLSEDWAISPSIELKSSFSSPFAESSLKVTIFDESARINLNKADREILERVFENIENPIEAVNNFLYYCGKEKSPQNEPIQKGEELSVIEELLLIQDITLEDYESLKGLVTVFGSDIKVNINTTDRGLLNILIDSLELSDPEGVRTEIFAVLDKESGYFGEGPSSFPPLSLLEEDRKKLSNLFKTNTDIFRIISEAEVKGTKKTIISVIDRNSDRLEALYWYEK